MIHLLSMCVWKWLTDRALKMFDSMLENTSCLLVNTLFEIPEYKFEYCVDCRFLYMLKKMKICVNISKVAKDFAEISK